MKKTRLLSLLVAVSMLIGTAAPLYAADVGGQAEDELTASDVSEQTTSADEPDEPSADETDVMSENTAEDTESMETEADETETVESDAHETEEIAIDEPPVEMSHEVESAMVGIPVESAVQYHINPIHSDVITVDDLMAMDVVPIAYAPSSGDTTVYYEDVESAADIFREAMKNRCDYVSVCYRFTEYSSEIAFAKLCEIIEAAMSHTGVPDEGDYIRWTYGGGTLGLRGYSNSTGYYITLSLTPKFYTDAEMEAAVDERIDEVLDELELDKLSDYKTIKAIYDYVCNNVVYDYDNLDDDDYRLKYTAYAALLDGTSVCQGYAVLMYRLLLEEGIDNRVIFGHSGGNHTWNIVEIDDLYYNIDATWDAPYAAAERPYKWFLLNMDNFTDHTRDVETGYDSESFHAAYPMASSNYTPRLDVASGECGDTLLWEINDDGVLTIRGDGTMDDYAYSSEQPWAAYNSNITAVVIEEGVEYIGQNAFSELENLKTVTIPASAANIHYTAFNWCKSLERITVSADNDYYDSDKNGLLYTEDFKTLYQYTTGSTATSFTLPEGVKNIYPNAFSQSRYLEYVTLPSSLAVINGSAFAYCPKLCEVTIPANVVTIGSGAFRGCESLTSITVDPENTSFSNDAYGVLYDFDKTVLIQFPAGNDKVNTYKTVPTTKEIGQFAFECALSLESVVLNHGLNIIHDYAFCSCIHLEGVTFPRTVTDIGNFVFKSNSHDLVLRGFADSAAAKYAKDNDLEFAAYKETITKGTPTVDGIRDNSYTSPGLYNLGSGANAYETDWDCSAEADIYLLYDEHYLYICAVVDDNDVLTKGEAFATGVNPYQNDDVEFRLSFNGTDATIKVSVDAYGYACFGLESHYNLVDYSAIKYATTHTDTRYIVEVAIPRSGENYNLFTDGEIGFTYQLNDIDENGKLQSHTTSFNGEAVKNPVFYELENYVEPELGDASGDGAVDNADAAMLVRYLSGWDGYGNGELIISALDVSGDGKLNNVDAAILGRHIAGWEGYETFPLNSAQ